MSKIPKIIPGFSTNVDYRQTFRQYIENVSKYLTFYFRNRWYNFAKLLGNPKLLAKRITLIAATSATTITAPAAPAAGTAISSTTAAATATATTSTATVEGGFKLLSHFGEREGDGDKFWIVNICSLRSSTN